MPLCLALGDSEWEREDGDDRDHVKINTEMNGERDGDGGEMIRERGVTALE